MIELNRDNFEDETTRSDVPVLVDFWGPRCGPCLRLMPAVEELEEEYSGRLKVTKLNSAENRLLCAKNQVMSLPTFLLFKDGKEAYRINGEDLTKEELKKAIDSVLD